MIKSNSVSGDITNINNVPMLLPESIIIVLVRYVYCVIKVVVFADKAYCFNMERNKTAMILSMHCKKRIIVLYLLVLTNLFGTINTGVE